MGPAKAPSPTSLSRFPAKERKTIKRLPGFAKEMRFNIWFVFVLDKTVFRLLVFVLFPTLRKLIVPPPAKVSLV